MSTPINRKGKRVSSNGLIVTLILFAASGMSLTLRLMYFALKPALTDAFNLDWMSQHWNKKRSIFLVVRYASAFMAFPGWLILVISAIDFAVNHSVSAFTSTQLAQGGVMFALFGFPFIASHWIEEYANDPEIQKQLAGERAETNVRDLVDQYASKQPRWKTLHNALFVFNADQLNEYSAEVDSILVTEKNIYVIETKFRSGTIVVDLDAKDWVTQNGQTQGVMRNAWTQVNNTTRVLMNECELPNRVVPLVAIYGNDVRIVDGPRNVIEAKKINTFIDSYEGGSTNDELLDIEIIYTRFIGYLKQDKNSLERHRQRANAAKQKITESANVFSS